MSTYTQTLESIIDGKIHEVLEPKVVSIEERLEMILTRLEAIADKLDPGEY